MQSVNVVGRRLSRIPAFLSSREMSEFESPWDVRANYIVETWWLRPQLIIRSAFCAAPNQSSALRNLANPKQGKTNPGSIAQKTQQQLPLCFHRSSTICSSFKILSTGFSGPDPPAMCSPFARYRLPTHNFLSLFSLTIA
jgi:hypothetical protein